MGVATEPKSSGTNIEVVVYTCTVIGQLGRVGSGRPGGSDHDLPILSFVAAVGVGTTVRGRENDPVGMKVGTGELDTTPDA